MSSSFFKYLFSTLLVIVIFLFFILFIFSQIVTYNSSNDLNYIYSNGSLFIWPLPGYSIISSYFGYRSSPTLGASSYHGGIDIPSPEWTPILSVCSGKVTFASWGAGGGYTIVVSNEDLHVAISYCHVAPIFNVHYGEFVKMGDALGFVRS